MLSVENGEQLANAPVGCRLRLPLVLSHAESQTAEAHRQGQETFYHSVGNANDGDEQLDIVEDKRELIKR